MNLFYCNLFCHILLSRMMHCTTYYHLYYLYFHFMILIISLMKATSSLSFLKTLEPEIAVHYKDFGNELKIIMQNSFENRYSSFAQSCLWSALDCCAVISWAVMRYVIETSFLEKNGLGADEASAGNTERKQNQI